MSEAKLVINGQRVAGHGVLFSSIDPGNKMLLWQGNSASHEQVKQAVDAAEQSFKTWSNLSVEQRLTTLKNFQKTVAEHKSDLTLAIAQEVGKPIWEAETEVDAVISKLDLAYEAYRQRTGAWYRQLNGIDLQLQHKALGVAVILSPFNFPAHIATSHLLPALLAGNTVILKPSEYSPRVASMLFDYFEQAGLPKGVVNLIQGAKEQAAWLLAEPAVRLVLFTGSYAVGKQIHQQLAGRINVLLAMEMGGNNPLVAYDFDDVTAVCYHIIQSAYITAGQRCTCARRLIIENTQRGDQVIKQLQDSLLNLRIGHYSLSPQPFYGPMISEQSQKAILRAQQQCRQAGGEILLESVPLLPGQQVLTPGLIDMTGVKMSDIEIFGPLLQVWRVDSFEQAIEEANATQYGLAAGLLSNDSDKFSLFSDQIQAGLINWNRPLTGASGAAPFGGIGYSGNYRPSGFYTADCCAYPVASLQQDDLTVPASLPPGIHLRS